jgi:predicted RNase H-like nuclease (RuvC/YqgF family)
MENLDQEIENMRERLTLHPEQKLSARVAELETRNDMLEKTLIDALKKMKELETILFELLPKTPTVIRGESENVGTPAA